MFIQSKAATDAFLNDRLICQLFSRLIAELAASYIF